MPLRNWLQAGKDLLFLSTRCTLVIHYRLRSMFSLLCICVSLSQVKRGDDQEIPSHYIVLMELKPVSTDTLSKLL